MSAAWLRCDYIGFHIPRQVENFVDVARGVAPLKVLEMRAYAPRYLTYGCAVGLDEVTTAIEGIAGASAWARTGSDASTSVFSRVGLTPLQFFFRAIPFEELVAYYALADVMWITPWRDGLNLVAKEYVAAQGLTDGSGVLVLSEFAGAAAELHGAVLTNPHDPHDLVKKCIYALEMSQVEAEARLRRWGQDFLDSVEESCQARAAALVETQEAANV